VKFLRHHSGLIADALTLSRIILSSSLALLGYLFPTSSIGLACILVMVCWFTDLVDGPIARLDNRQHTTRLSKMDAEADMAISLGVTLYLLFAGFISSWLAILLFTIILGIWLFHSRFIAWPFYIVPYILLLNIAFHETPLIGWIMVCYVVILLVTRWSRLRSEYLPDFFKTIKRLFQRYN